jgi:hypothetical protein
MVGRALTLITRPSSSCFTSRSKFFSHEHDDYAGPQP